MSRATSQDLHTKLKKYVDSLPDLKYWDRTQKHSNRNAVLHRESSVFVQSSHAVPGLEGVFSKDRVLPNSRLLDYCGYLMTYREFKKMPIAVYTAFQIDTDMMNQMNQYEKISPKNLDDQYMLVGDPLCMAAKLVSTRGPSNAPH